jgi:hypothetical protein
MFNGFQRIEKTFLFRRAFWLKVLIIKSEPLQPGVRFLCDPLPTQLAAHLTARLPKRQQYGLSTHHQHHPR